LLHLVRKGAVPGWLQPDGCERLAHDRDHRRDIDAHRANHVAAPALGAGVEGELLPLLEILCSDVAHYESAQPAHRRHLAQVKPPQRIDLENRRVLAITGGFVEMAGLGAHAAVDASLEVGGVFCVDAAAKNLLGTLDALLRRHRLGLWRLAHAADPLADLAQPACIHLHAFTPLRSIAAPTW
jgi:hypothetical protein